LLNSVNISVNITRHWTPCRHATTQFAVYIGHWWPSVVLLEIAWMMVRMVEVRFGGDSPSLARKNMADTLNLTMVNGRRAAVFIRARRGKPLCVPRGWRDERLAKALQALVAAGRGRVVEALHHKQDGGRRQAVDVRRGVGHPGDGGWGHYIRWVAGACGMGAPTAKKKRAIVAPLAAVLNSNKLKCAYLSECFKL
jgi:hypothetical protein